VEAVPRSLGGLKVDCAVGVVSRHVLSSYLSRRRQYLMAGTER
jgi:hypothetical protein